MKNWIEHGHFIKKNTSLPNNKITFTHTGNRRSMVFSKYAKECFNLRFKVEYFRFRQIRMEIPILGIASWREADSEFFYTPGSYAPQRRYNGDDVVEISNIASWNRFEIRDALGVFLKFQLVDEELINRVADLIGVNDDENALYNSCLELLHMHDNEIDSYKTYHAIKLAKCADKAGHHSIVFRLAEYLRAYYLRVYSTPGKKANYQAESKIEEVIDLYRSINVSNPHYSEAMKRVEQMEKWGVETLHFSRFFSGNTKKEEQPIQRYPSYAFE